MSQVVVYRQDNGVPAVLMPTPEALKVMTIQQIAAKDVPAGKPFAIIDVSELPQAPQETWVMDDEFLSDGVGEQQ
jgi:hypothetical protein